MKIGMFDSGVGGLNVLKEFIKVYPNNQYYYYGDTKNIPYGDKDKETLLKLSINIIKFFIEKNVDLIIIACGTISSTCIKELRSITTIPILDIISPTIQYLKKNPANKILVFGTKRTIENHIFKNNLTNVIEVSTPEFVPMIENNHVDTLIIKSYLKNYIDIDILVLGCTHYPLLINEFKKYLKDETKILDMGKILVNTIPLKNNSVSSIKLYFTKIDKVLEENIKKIIKTSYTIEQI